MINKPKGTYDVSGSYGKKILYVEKLLKDIMEVYNYEYVRTPIFESSELFHRGVGETTDIVSKETYDFKDRGDRMNTLRPEGTAGAVRSYIENKRYADPNVPAKLWYYGPMYRYERPQAGRYREFYQFGIEALGSNEPMLDAEIVSIAVNFYKILGLKGIKVKINSLGDTESRNNYREALLAHFKPEINNLCFDCQERYNKNPLRILDCKIDKEKEALKTAPTTLQYLNEESLAHFENVKKYLNILNIEYVVDTNLVRGLDYYTHTVFEVEAEVEGFGAQNVLCGGGRYNNLVKTLDGPDTPGVGFALGMERLLTALEFEGINPIKEEIDAYVIAMGDDAKDYVVNLTQALRLSGFKTDVDYLNRNIKSNFKQAERLNARYILIIGDDEIKNNIVTVKVNETKEEFKVETDDLIYFLDELENMNVHGHEHGHDCACGNDPEEEHECCGSGGCSH